MVNGTLSPVVCGLTSNVSCWLYEVHRLNEEFTDLMFPVVILMICLLTVGIAGNSVVLVVYINRNNRTTANIFIMYLAGIDLMACAVIHPYVIYKLFNNYGQTWTVACKIFEFTVHASLAVSGLTLLAVAIDRYLAICRPVKFLHFYKHIYKIVLATFATGIIGSTPLLIFYGSEPEIIQMSDYTFIGYKCEYTKTYNGSAMTGYSAFVVCGFLLEIVAMIVLYKNVAVVAYRSRRTVKPISETPGFFSDSNKTSPLKIATQTTKTSHSSPQITVKVIQEDNQVVDHSYQQNLISKQTKLTKMFLGSEINTPKSQSGSVTMTNVNSVRKSGPKQRPIRTRSMSSGLKAAKMLFLVTAVYLLSWLPFFILRVLHTSGIQSWTNRPAPLKVLEHFLNHCFYINNAANPIIYSVINKNFRLDCWKILKRLCGLRN